MTFNFNPQLVVSKDDIKPNPSKVGEKVYEFLQKPQDNIEVGEIIEEYAKSYVKEIQDVVSKGIHKYESPFYIVVLHKKEAWAVNVMRNWFVARQSKPSARTLRQDYPNHSHTVYCFDIKNHELKLLWNLPTWQDGLTILKNKHLYHPELVQWIQDFDSKKLT